MSSKLTLKQTMFVKEYLKDLNATQAAIRSGYSERTAEKIGSENLRKPDVAAAIDAAMTKRAEKVDVSSERVLKEISAMAFWDPAELTGAIRQPDGSFLVEHIRGPDDIRLMPENVRRAIVGWSWDKMGHFTMKFADKSKALDQLARHLSLYNDKLNVNVTTGLADRLARAKERLKKKNDGK